MSRRYTARVSRIEREGDSKRERKKQEDREKERERVKEEERCSTAGALVVRLVSRDTEQ